MHACVGNLRAYTKARTCWTFSTPRLAESEILRGGAGNFRQPRNNRWARREGRSRGPGESSRAVEENSPKDPVTLARPARIPHLFLVFASAQPLPRMAT